MLSTLLETKPSTDFRWEVGFPCHDTLYFSNGQLLLSRRSPFLRLSVSCSKSSMSAREDFVTYEYPEMCTVPGQGRHSIREAYNLLPLGFLSPEGYSHYQRARDQDLQSWGTPLAVSCILPNRQFQCL